MLVINGTSVLNFFITNTGDPHDLFASYYVPVAQLLTQDKLTIPYQGELDLVMCLQEEFTMII